MDNGGILSLDDEDLEWIEQQAFAGSTFRIWHVLFMGFFGFLAIVVLVCCCVKFRVPRTKQEIEADYQRKRIAKKFEQRMQLIPNQEMDCMDLKSALERVRKDFAQSEEAPAVGLVLDAFSDKSGSLNEDDRV